VSERSSETTSGSPSSPSPAAPPLLAFAIVVLVAVGLRFWNLGSVGVSSAVATRSLAAALGEPTTPPVPPLVPWIFRALFAVWQPVDTLATAAIALSGIATVLAVFLAVRRWLGETVGIVAAAALAGMELHLCYSRQARPEVAQTLFLLVLVWIVASAIDGRSLALGLAAIPAAAATFLVIWPAELLPPRAEVIGFAARSLAAWVSPVVLAAAVVGLAVMLGRRSRADLVVLAWIVLALVLIPFLRRDPGSLVPLLPPLAVAGAVGLDFCVRKLAPGWERGKATVLATAVLAAGTWPSLAQLAVEDNGYELAARYLLQGRPDPRPDVLVSESAIHFYMEATGGSHSFLEGGDPRALAALESGEFRYLVGDLRLLRSPGIRAFVEERAGELRPLAVIGNPLPEPTIAAAAGFEALDLAASPEHGQEVTSIRIWRSTRPAPR